MTKKTLLSMALALLVCTVDANTMTSATVTDAIQDDIMHAVGVLKGIYVDYSKEQAISILQSTAEKDTTAYAMNVLGLAYMEGLGTEPDAEKAKYWLGKAAESGFADAYHNLGVMYKLGKCGEKQDFQAAYDAFSQGVAVGSDACRYGAGFMLYKGLGCKQDYTKAKELFETASANGNVYATYMLGLCYRNGYGTQRDEGKGMELLEKSATFGYSAAIEELMRATPENSLTDIGVSDSIFAAIPSSMPNIHADVNDTTLLRGQYSGFIVMYDWSGQHVIGERPVTMNIGRNEKDVFGYLFLGTDSVPFRADVSADGSLMFKKSYASLDERYTFGKKMKYRLSNASLDIWKDKIQGSLNLYSLSLREPERPMYMELYRRGYVPSDNASTYGHITITPNPFASQFDAVFELADNASAVVRIFDKSGIAVWRQELGNLEAGSHRISLSPDIKPDSYVLNISAGNQILRTIIVKKGGF